MEIKLTDYLPDINAIDQDDLLDARSRIEIYLKGKEEFRTVDMRPNSVFGDLILSPMSHILASFEIAANRIFSDTDLANVAAGTVYNCDFVKQYLNNFGQGQVYEYPSSGTIQLTWGTPTTKYIDVGSKFLFESEGQEDYIYELSNVDDTLTILSPFEKRDFSNTNELQLIRLAEDRFIVNVPVIGPAGVGVNDGTQAATDLSHADLIGAVALGDFDRGTLPENVMELANKVQKTYYSSTLNNRTGATSFLLQMFPELRGVSPTLSGDWEMIRDRENILGVKEGKMDLHVKSRSQYLSTEQEIKMTYNQDDKRWYGSTDTLEPIVLIDSISRNSASSESVIENIYGKSLDEAKCPGLSCSYSNFEQLGFSLQDVTTTTDVHPSISLENAGEKYSTPQGFDIMLSGAYAGGPFSRDYERRFSLYFIEVFDSGGVAKLRAILKDEVYKDDSFELILSQDPVVSNRALLESVESWNQALNGLDLTITENSGSAFGATMGDLVGTNISIHVTGRGATFSIRYRYDPNFSIINNIISDEKVQPVNTDILLRNFLTCHVYEIKIDYRKKEGQNVDLIKAREEITNYVNRLTYPYSYEEYTVAEVLLFYGAEGVQQITQKGQFFRSLANKYHFDDNGSSVESDIENPYTSTLRPSNEYEGMGSRNINYILDAADIKFNAIII